MNFIATSLKPFCSNFLIILPTRPLCTPSGLTMIKVRSLASAIARENNEKIDKIVAIIRLHEEPIKKWNVKDRRKPYNLQMLRQIRSIQ